MTIAETGKSAGKRPYVNAPFSELEELVDRGLTTEELHAIAAELGFRKQKPRTLALMERVSELLQEGAAGVSRSAVTPTDG